MLQSLLSLDPSALPYAAVCAFVLLVVLFSCCRRRLPKQYRPVPESLAPRDPRREGVDKDHFSMKKVSDDLDAIVIGSGIGGLACAGYLARAGWRVLVLEQHYVAGGCMHEFEDRGYSFDTGVHYVNADKYDLLLSPIIHPSHSVRFHPLGCAEDGYTYDRIKLNDEEPFCFRKGRRALQGDLEAEFPEEKEAIRKYFALMFQSMRLAALPYLLKVLPWWVRALLGRPMMYLFNRLNRKSAWQVASECTKNKRLRALLLAQFGDVGGPPNKSTFMMQAGVMTHYLSGGHYPIEGPSALPKAIIPTIEYAGGRVLVKANVQSILVSSRSGRAVGVQMAGHGDDNPQILAKHVVSAAGVLNTFTRLLPEQISETLPVVARIRDAVAEVGASVGHMYAFVGIRGSQAELQLPSSNLWVLPCGEDYDLAGMCEQLHADPLSGRIPCFIGFPSAKDPTFNERFPGKSTCVVLTEGNWDWFAKWADKRQGHRGEDYEQLKRDICQRLLDCLYDNFPQLKGRVEYTEFASPLSNSYYLNAPKGESLGLAAPPRRFDMTKYDFLRPDTDIPGLWLAGQDVASPGVLGGFAGGLMCALKMLGYMDGVWDLITLRNPLADFNNVKWWPVESKSKRKSE